MQIYIALVSLHSTLNGNDLSFNDVPGFVSKLGFTGIEILDRQLLLFDARRLELLKRQCEEHSCGIVVDASCDLTYPPSTQRHDEIKHVKKVIHTAELLGCSVVRITLGGQSIGIQKIYRRMRNKRTNRRQRIGALKKLLSTARIRRAGYLWRSFLANYQRLNETKLQNAVDSLNDILPVALDRGISLAIENHWGISSRPEWITRVIDIVDSPNVGTCPDFGNFPTKTDRYTALAKLVPRALHVQAKCWHFGADGEESTIDYGRCIQTLRKGGYDRTIAIEYEGSGDEISACKKARDLILQYD
ncbi:MAG: sugar phosphate isomerase/epimerase family protein [Arenicellales bacterium]|nr:sugar phosphate isomerase/epimerase family protein [Arenicellales bacterium]